MQCSAGRLVFVEEVTAEQNEVYMVVLGSLQNLMEGVEGVIGQDRVALPS